MKILIWNIQFFTERRINDSRGADQKEKTYNQNRTAANLSYIMSTVEQADPDVFVVLEVLCTKGDLSTLAGGGGPGGLLLMLKTLRDTQKSWCLVPPLRMNPGADLGERTYTETAGVFFRTDRVAFTGPFIWPATDKQGNPSPTGPPMHPSAVTPAKNYPPPWDGAMPAGALAAAAPIVWYKGLRQGAQDYTDITFDTDGRQGRRPVLTDFLELKTNLTTRLLSVHLPPNHARAKSALTSIASLAANYMKPDDAMRIVIAGDFNIDLMKDKMYWPELEQWRKGFNHLFPTGKSIFATTKDATAGQYFKEESLDMALFLYGAKAVPKYANAWLVDRVFGNLPFGQLPGFKSDMAEANPFAVLNNENKFRLPENFGHIGRPQAGRGASDPEDPATEVLAAGTSDHLPLLVIIE